MLLKNSLNAGTAGATITTGNSGGGSGDAFNSITGTPTYAAATGTRAPLAAEIGDDDSVAWRNWVLTGRELWVRAYVRFASLPSADDWFLELNILSGGISSAGRLMVGPTGTIFYRRTTTTATLVSVPSAVTAGQWVRLELRVLTGITTSNGAVDLWVYPSVEAATTTLQAGATGVNTGTVVPNEVGFVYLPGITLTYDDVAISDQGKLGPAYPANPAVIVQQAGSAEQAQAMARRKRRTTGQSMSLETAAAIRPVKRGTLGQPIEAGTAVAVVARKVRSVGAAHESGGALPVTPAHRRQVGQAAEADQAFEVSNGTFIGTATEADEALPITPRKVRLLGQALDASVAAAVRPGRARTIGPATESGLAREVGRRKIRVVAVAFERDQARPVTLLGREITGTTGPHRTWSATLARRGWSADPPRRTWSTSRA